MKRVFILVLAVLEVALSGVSAHAAERCDSTAFPARWFGAVGIGAASVAVGSLARPATSSFTYTEVPGGQHHSPITDVEQYATVVFPWAIKAAGGATRSGWGRMAVSQGIGAVLAVGTTEMVKRSADELRPDGSNRRSFPSGHSTVAYMGATMIARELSWRSPWYGMGGYAVASAVGMQRVMSRRHYPTDVAAGAGIGIIGTELGYMAGDLIFGGRGLDSRYVCSRGEASVGPRLQLSDGLIFTPGKVAVDGGRLHRRPALYTAVGAQCPVTAHLSLGADVQLLSTPVEYIPAAGEAFAPAPQLQNQLGVAARPTYNIVVSPLAMIEIYASAGYRWNISPRNRLGLGAGTYTAGAGVAASMPVADRFSIGVEVGYTASRHRYKLQGTTYAGTDHSIVAGASTRVNF